MARAHIIAWRGSLEARELAPATVRRKLAAISSLFDHLCNENAVPHNPVGGVKRPAADNNEGKTPALSDEQARLLLKAPEGDSIKATRDRAILSVYLSHALRRTELADLWVGDLTERRGVMHFRVFGKGSKTRYVPVHLAALASLQEYLTLAGHGEDAGGRCFDPSSITAPGSSMNRSRVTGCTRCSRSTRLRPGLRSTGCVCTRCGRRRRPMPWRIRRISRVCRCGWGIRTSARHGCMTGGGRGGKIRRLLR